MLKSPVTIIILLRLILISLRYFADHQNIYIDHKIDNTTIKEKMRLISLWFIMFFLKEKCNWKSQTLMYVITLRWLFLLVKCLEKVTYDRWLRALTIFFPSSNVKLGMFWIINYRDFWINIISIFWLFSKMISVRRWFFWTFCEKILRLFKIILYHYPQISKLN